ncbi:hypothetical protein RF11_10574 [Thelohanellus kitauei]|uniref:Uncharacterized protein n=1 Tax=Thelohanellus kitauei TaxID=669202 RepID=A0A0C2J9J4_THEKT|nr:hypothetical protein RF11_10574 [Thelohanellus kitauei]
MRKECSIALRIFDIFLESSFSVTRNLAMLLTKTRVNTEQLRILNTILLLISEIDWTLLHVICHSINPLGYSVMITTLHVVRSDSNETKELHTQARELLA